MARFSFAVLFLLLSACGPADSPSTGNPNQNSVAQVAEQSVSNSTDISGGATLAVEVHEGTNMSAAVSPDGNQIVSSIQGTLFVMNVEGGTAESITDYYYDAREPSWSRDGTAIVFHGYRNGTWDIWQIQADGSNAQALTNDEFDDREPTFSPLSDAVAFSSDRDGNYDIWLLENGQLQQLTSETENAHSPAWSPDGTSLAFAVNVGAGNYEIRTIELAGDAGMQAKLKLLELESGQDKILSAENADVFPFRASWTENNTLVYTASGEIRKMIIDEAETVIPFSASFNIEREPYQRRQRNYDGAAKTVLGITAPVISSDGEWVAFSALADIWLLQVSSGELNQITSDSYANRSPVFSTDGNKIAFLSDRSGASVVWLYDRTTQLAEKLDGDLEITNMSWSPDGEKLAGFMAAPGNPLSAQLAIVNLESGEPQMVYRPIPSQKVSWSADGQQVITAVLDRFSTRYREGVYNLLAIDTQTGDTVQTTPTPHNNMTSLVMDADGETFTYVQEALLWRARLDGTGEPVSLTDSLTDDPSFSADGEYAVFMSGDKMFRLSTSTGEQLDISPQLAYSRSIPEKSWVLRVGNLFNGTDNAYQQNVDIVIAGNRIQAIEPQAPRSVEIVDMSDKTVIPGMFEMHAHLGDLSESQGRNLLSYGITSVRDPGSNPYLAKGRQEAWDSGSLPGPRSHITGYLTDGNRVYYSIAEGLVSVEHVNRVIERTRLLELDFIKTYVRLPDDWQKMIVDAAHEMGIPTSSHELFPAANNGMDHVEHIGGTSRRGYQPKVSQTGHVYQDVIDLLAKSGMGITPTVVLSGGFSVIAFEDDDLFESPQFNTFYGSDFPRRNRPGADVNARANGMAIRELVDAGALVVTGTDAPIVPLGVGLHGELRLFTRAGLSPFETLRAATVSSATAAGVIQDTGSLEVGKLADMVVVDGDPLNDIKDADNVVMTIKNGRAYSLQELLN